MKKRLQRMIFFFSVMVLYFAFGTEVQADVPHDLIQIDAQENTIRLQWRELEGAQWYGYQIAYDSDFSAIVKSGSQNSVSEEWNAVTVDGLEQGNTYYARVGWGYDSDHCFQLFCGGIEVITSPAMPENVKYAGADEHTAVLTWNPYPDAEEYRVRYNGEVFSTRDTRFSLSLKNGGEGKVSISACKRSADGFLAEGTARVIRGISPLTMKISKKNFGIEKNYNTKGIIYVKAVFQGSGYEVEGVTVSGKKHSFSGQSLGGSSALIRIGGIKNDQMYKYRVRAFVRGGENQFIYGNWSDYALFCSQKKVSYVSANRKLKLKWDAMPGVSKVRVQISMKQKSGYRTCATVPVKKKTYTIKKYGKSKLKKGKSYYIRLIPVGKLGTKQVLSDAVLCGKVKVK